MSDAKQREEAVFEAALQLQGAERAAYLDQACAGDPALRGRIEGLLGALARAGGLLDKPALPRETAAGIPAPAPIEKMGDRIGRYKLLQQIGEGGCGVVYMAEQEEPVRRRVAVKILKLGMDTKQVIARFEAERQALALMDHPHIAKVLDAGATDMGRPFFVMELVRGVKITGFCDENKLSTADRLKLFIQVCQAVQHAHQKGIIHRDLKPSNILVTVNDGVPLPKVIDFGIAKATDGQVLTDKTLFTAFEQFIGTPAYMSPEQAVMTSLDIDTRTDIYSLGVLMYELLTGKTPFDTKELLQSGFDEMRRTIREKEPVRPSTRLNTMVEGELTTTAQRRHTDPLKLIHSVCGDLDWIVMKCLEKDRGRRYETANGLAADLRRHLANEPVVARPPSAAYRFQKFAHRNRIALAAGSAVFLALLIGLTVSLWQSIGKSRAYRQATASEQKSREVARFLKEMLNGVGPSVALGRDTKLLLEIVDKTAERVGQDLKGQPEVEAELGNTLGEVYRALGENVKAEAMHRRALELSRQLFGEANARVAEAENNLALVLRDEGKFIEAETLFHNALSQFRQARGAVAEDVAAAQNNLAGVLQMGKLAESEATQREALEVIRKLYGAEHARVALCQQNLSAILQLSGKQAEAEALAGLALALFRKVHGNEHPEVAGALANQAYVLSEAGKLTEAESASREALALRRKLLAPGHPDIAKGLTELANILIREAKLAEAEAAYREALSLLRERLGNENRFVAFVLSGLGDTAANQGQLAEAEALQREALELRRRRLGDEHPDVVRSLYAFARVLRQQGKLPEADSLLREALRTTLKLVGPEHPYTINAYHTLALVAEDQHRLADAERLFGEALTLRLKISNEDHPDTAALRDSLGRALAGQNKFAEAEIQYRRALAVRERRLPPEHFDLFTTSIDLGRLLADWAWAERPKAGEIGRAQPQVNQRGCEAELLLRKGLTICETQPTANPGMVGDVRNRLGGALLALAVTDPALEPDARQAEFIEAESLLRSSFELLQRSPATPPKYQRDALERLRRLYSAWNEFAPDADRAAKAAEFTQQLTDFDLVSTKP